MHKFPYEDIDLKQSVASNTLKCSELGFLYGVLNSNS